MSDAETAMTGTQSDRSSGSPSVGGLPSGGTESRAQGRGPTAPWVAIVATLLILFSFAWWLAYAWDFVPGLDPLGAWNYLLALGLIVSGAVMMRFWRGA